jgi:hypothetical protein
MELDNKEPSTYWPNPDTTYKKIIRQKVKVEILNDLIDFSYERFDKFMIVGVINKILWYGTRLFLINDPESKPIEVYHN